MPRNLIRVPEPLLRPEQAAEVLGIPEGELLARARAGVITHIRIGPHYRFERCVLLGQPSEIPDLEPTAEPPPPPLPPETPRRRPGPQPSVGVNYDAIQDAVDRGLVSRDLPVVYIVQVGDDGPMKIGWVKVWGRLRGRLHTLQIGCPYPIYVRRLLQGDATLEAQLHERFKRYRMRGEWFRPVPSLRKFAAESEEVTPELLDRWKGRGGG